MGMEDQFSWRISWRAWEGVYSLKNRSPVVVIMEFIEVMLYVVVLKCICVPMINGEVVLVIRRVV